MSIRSRTTRLEVGAPHCIRGRAKATKHVSTGGVDESTVPVVGFDYAFISDRSGARSEDEEEVDKDLEDKAVVKVLVAQDSKPKACAAIPVPQKGIDPDEWAVRESLKYLDFLGYQKLVVKTDQERALMLLSPGSGNTEAQTLRRWLSTALLEVLRAMA